MGGFAFVYAFVALVDPWNVLPLSPPLPRVPISTNARFTFPALARSPEFDSAVFGTSTARLLDPAVLNPIFGARFANLAMNSATATEQSRLLAVFARAHPQAHTVIIGLDAAWCTDWVERNSRPFPEWMYGGSPWRGYREIATLYAVQEAANQFATMLGLKRRRYGLDGYTSFVPPESAYDPARVAEKFAEFGNSTMNGNGRAFPVMPLLEADLRALPAATRKLLFFVPYYVGQQGEPGSPAADHAAACKDAAVAVARRVQGTEVADFMIPSPITQDRNNYWDPLHYRVPIAGRVARDLASATTEDDVKLWPK